jgi:hypothetical protein
MVRILPNQLLNGGVGIVNKCCTGGFAGITYSVSAGSEALHLHLRKL